VRCGLVCRTFLVAVIGFLSVGARAGDEGDWIVWDGKLEVVRGALTGIDGRGVRLVDAHGLDATIGDPVAILRREDREAKAIGLGDPYRVRATTWGAIVTLTDGQVWEAEILDGDSDDLSLRVRWIGRVDVPLDVVRSVVMVGGEADAWDLRVFGEMEESWGGLDSVVLENGDVVKGTVLSIGDAVEIEGDSGMVRVDLNSVRRVGLVNPESALPPVRVWFSSGSVLGAREFGGGGDSAWVLEAVRATVDDGVFKGLGRVIISDGGAVLVGVEFSPGRLVALSSLEIGGYEPEGGRRWTAGPTAFPGGSRLGLDDVVFPGPMTTEFILPRGAVRVSGAFRPGDRAGAWLDCRVSIEQGGEVLWGGRVRRGSGDVAFSVDVDGGQALTVRVLAGAYGPIEDRVVLGLGWVLVDESGGD
jgi:hypothetical protein